MKKASDLISALEATPRFSDDPPILVRLAPNGAINGAVYGESDIRNIRWDAEQGHILIYVHHICPKPETADHYYWNGKLLDAMDRDELQAALVMMLDKQPVAKITGTAPAAKDAPKATTPAPAKS